MGKLVELSAVVKGIRMKVARRKLDDPELSRAINLAVDEIRHNLTKAIENGKLESEAAVVVESNRLQEAVKAEFTRHKPLLMKMVTSAVRKIEKNVLAGLDEEQKRIHETVQGMTQNLSITLTGEVSARAQELHSSLEAELAALGERCDQRLRAVEAAVLDACSLQDAERERRIAALHEFLNNKEQEIHMSIESEATAAKARIQQLAQQEPPSPQSLGQNMRWVVVEEKSTGRTVHVLLSDGGRQLYCGACAGSSCRHTIKVAEALRLKQSSVPT